MWKVRQGSIAPRCSRVENVIGLRHVVSLEKSDELEYILKNRRAPNRYSRNHLHRLSTSPAFHKLCRSSRMLFFLEVEMDNVTFGTVVAMGIVDVVL